MNLSKPEREALFLGIEDLSGLWELTWEDSFSSLPGDERITLARRVIESLLNRGLVRLVRARDPGNRPVEELEQEEWQRALADPQSWEEPGPQSGPITVRFETTAAGEAAYQVQDD